MTAIEIGDDLAELDAAVEALPNNPAVFLLWPKGAPREAAGAPGEAGDTRSEAADTPREAADTRGDAAEGKPYLSKTNLLRRRLLRLLKEREKPSRLLNLRHTLRRIEYWLTGSAFESGVVLYEQARRLFPETYLEVIRLRMPPYVRIVLSNQFPRSHVTTHLTHSGGLHFGPFRSRASAERFEGQFLDLFQVRRCQEDLVPSPEHPGCIYGEMGMCLRPCQQVVGPAEYRHEVERAAEFLRTGGRSMLDAIERSRDRLSEEMLFEEAARQHKRLRESSGSSEAARRTGRRCGPAERRGDHPLRRPRSGRDVARPRGKLAGAAAPELSKSTRASRFRSTARCARRFAAVAPRKLTVRERQEYLALLSRWYYSSWRDGEWLGFESYQDIPYRKLVNAVSRVAGGK